MDFSLRSFAAGAILTLILISSASTIHFTDFDPQTQVDLGFGSDQQVETIDEKIVLQQDDVDLMNTLWDDLTVEEAYCFDIDQETRVTDVQVADTREASETHIRFDPSNCDFSPGNDVGFMHTHPSRNLELSDFDKEVFLEDWDDVDYSCVQYGLVRDIGGQTDAAGINCYSDEGVDLVIDDFPRVDVLIEGSES